MVPARGAHKCKGAHIAHVKASGSGVERLGRKETEVHKVWRYEGAGPTRKLHTCVRILKWCAGTQEFGWRVSQMKADMWADFRKPTIRWAAALRIDFWLEMFREERPGRAQMKLTKSTLVQTNAWTRVLNTAWARTSDRWCLVYTDDKGMF